MSQEVIFINQVRDYGHSAESKEKSRQYDRTGEGPFKITDFFLVTIAVIYQNRVKLKKGVTLH